MINVRCKRCGKIYEIVEKVPIDLTCPVCGGVDIEFDCKVKRKCLACGYTEAVSKGENCKAFHQKSLTSIRRYRWAVEKVLDPTEAVKRTYNKTRRIIKRNGK